MGRHSKAEGAAGQIADWGEAIVLVKEEVHKVQVVQTEPNSQEENNGTVQPGWELDRSDSDLDELVLHCVVLFWIFFLAFFSLGHCLNSRSVDCTPAEELGADHWEAGSCNRSLPARSCHTKGSEASMA